MPTRVAGSLAEAAAGPSPFHARLTQPTKRARTHSQEVRHGAAAQAALLPAAAHLRLQAHAWAAADVDGADALGAVQLVPADGQQVDVHRIDVNRDLAHSLQGRAGGHGGWVGDPHAVAPQRQSVALVGLVHSSTQRSSKTGARLHKSAVVLPYRTCAASVWKNTFRSRHSLPISASGCTTPISLFTAITDTCARARRRGRALA